jgi:hypothetical protein
MRIPEFGWALWQISITFSHLLRICSLTVAVSRRRPLSRIKESSAASANVTTRSECGYTEGTDKNCFYYSAARTIRRYAARRLRAASRIENTGHIKDTWKNAGYLQKQIAAMQIGARPAQPNKIKKKVLAAARLTPRLFCKSAISRVLRKEACANGGRRACAYRLVLPCPVLRIPGFQKSEDYRCHCCTRRPRWAHSP